MTLVQTTYRDWSKTPQGEKLLFELGASAYYVSKLVENGKDADGPHHSALSHLEQLFIESVMKNAVNEIRTMLHRPEVVTGLRPTHGPVIGAIVRKS